MKFSGRGASNRSKFLTEKMLGKLKNHAIMRIYELAINDFWVRKVNFGDHFTLPGSRCQYRQFFRVYGKLIHTISQDI